MFSNSAYECIGVGYVIRDMAPGDYDCHVVLLNSLTRYSSNIGNALYENVKVKDDAEEETDVQLVNKGSIRCLWIGEGAGNRVTAPTLGKGAKVVVYKLKYSSDYYWEQLGTKAHTTKKEHVIWMFNSSKYSPGLDELPTTDSNKETKSILDYWNSSYILQIDTVRQYIGLRTSNKAGEATIFNMEFDCKYGNYQLIDGNGCGWEILSKLGRLRTRTPGDLCERADVSKYVKVKVTHNESIGGFYMSRIGKSFVREVKGDIALKTNKHHLEAKSLEYIIDGDIKYKVKTDLKYHSGGEISFITNSGKIGFYTTGNIELMGMGGINIYSSMFTVNGVINALSLNLGGSAGEPPNLSPEKIERTKWEILDKVEEAITSYNQVKKEADEKKEKEEKEKETIEELEDPTVESGEESEQDAIANLKGKMNFNIEKGITFTTNGRFDVEAKQGLSLKGGPGGEDLLKLIGGVIAEMGKICQNLTIPSSVIGVTPMGGPLVAGCAPMVAQSIPSVTKLLTTLNLIAGSPSTPTRQRAIAASYISKLKEISDNLESQGFSMKEKKITKIKPKETIDLDIEL